MTHADLQVREEARAEIRRAVEAVREKFPDEFRRAEEETSRRSRPTHRHHRSLSEVITDAFSRARHVIGLE